MPLLHEALTASECVISVMDPYACKDSDVIFGRKIADCDTVDDSFWVVKSIWARPAQVQEICNCRSGYVIY